MRHLLLIPFLLACSTITEEDFLVSYSEEKCSQIFSCVSGEDQATLDEIYGSQEQCAIDMQADLSSSIEINGLEFQSQQAEECLSHIQTNECNTESTDEDPCNLVWIVVE